MREFDWLVQFGIYRQLHNCYVYKNGADTIGKDSDGRFHFVLHSSNASLLEGCEL